MAPLFTAFYVRFTRFFDKVSQGLPSCHINLSLILGSAQREIWWSETFSFTTPASTSAWWTQTWRACQLWLYWLWKVRKALCSALTNYNRVYSQCCWLGPALKKKGEIKYTDLVVWCSVGAATKHTIKKHFRRYMWRHCYLHQGGFAKTTQQILNRYPWNVMERWGTTQGRTH